MVRQSVIDTAIIGLRSRVNEGAIIENSMIMGADYYESDDQRTALLAEGKVPIGIGANSHLRQVIVDKNGRIGKNCKILNTEGVMEASREEQGYYIKSGIVVVLRNGTIPDGTII